MVATKRLFQTIGDKIREKIVDGEYKVGEKLPSERVIGETFNVSRTVVREAIIMLELEGYVEVRKGSGIYVIESSARKNTVQDSELENFVRHIVTQMKMMGPFELLQARQLLECSVAGFAASQVTRADIDELQRIQREAALDPNRRDSVWDKQFHKKIGEMTNNSIIVLIIELLWFGRENNPLWLKLHEHIDESNLNSWLDEHSKIIDAFMRKDSAGAKKAQWEHIESTRQALYDASSADDNPYDKYLFQDDPTKYF